MDAGRNVGAFTTGKVASPRTMKVAAKGVLRRGRRGNVVVTVKDSTNKPVSAAALRSSGAGSKAAKARTGRKGTGTAPNPGDEARDREDPRDQARVAGRDHQRQGPVRPRDRASR